MNFRIDLPGPEIWVSRGGRGISSVEPCKAKVSKHQSGVSKALVCGGGGQGK